MDIHPLAVNMGGCQRLMPDVGSATVIEGVSPCGRNLQRTIHNPSTEKEEISTKQYVGLQTLRSPYMGVGGKRDSLHFKEVST